MFSLDELLQQVEAYQYKRLSLKDLERWFEDNFDDVDASEDSRKLRLAIDAALAEYHFDHVGENIVREELAEAIRPFCYEVRVYAQPIELVCGKASQKTAAFRPLVLRSLLTVLP
jgi:hypothetical protein